jgi:hypothetical protein
MHCCRLADLLRAGAAGGFEDLLPNALLHYWLRVAGSILGVKVA